jgi:enoyl-CoA hydratase/carnithine racemase
MSDKEIIFERKERAAVLTFNRPEVHNAFNQAMSDELAIALD